MGGVRGGGEGGKAIEGWTQVCCAISASHALSPLSKEASSSKCRRMAWASEDQGVD